jgi:capsular polysaccharide transport system permease protein
MESAYGRSALGYLWAVGEPAAGILLLTLIFSIAFTAPPLGSSFAFFYASGMLPFLAYLETGQRVSQAIRFSRPLLAYPGVTYLHAILARFLLAALTEFMVAALVIGALVLALRIDTILAFEAIALAFAMAAALGLGIGTLNCFLIEVFPSWERLWAILTRPLFLISAIVFTFESVPEPYRSWLWFNPLVHVVGALRRGLYPTYEGAYLAPAYVFGLAALAFAAGLVLLGRHHRNLIHV